MNAQDLKNSILQLAIQGKLVEQRPEEGTAEEFYDKIQTEKSRLITEGKIKKEKILPEITEAEILFEIPESWKWVRISDIAFLKSGNQYDESPDGLLYLKVADMNLPENQYEICASTRRTNAKATDIIQVGSIIFPKRGGAISTNKKRLVLREPICIDSNTMAMTVVTATILPYLSSWFSSVDLGKLATGTSVPQINNKDIYPLLVPLPPLEEQERIVAKIEELMPYVEKYGVAQSNLDAFNKKFPEDMQKSILQYAIQGKLVEQRPEEGTAHELYEKIQIEKARLIAGGKIRKEKALPEITKDEIPFAIPDSWKWVRLSEVIDIRDGTHDSPKYVLDGVPLVTSKNLSDGRIDFSNVKLISQEDSEMINKRSGVNNSDILFAMIGSIGNPVLVDKDREFSIKNMALFKSLNKKTINMRYVLRFLDLEQYGLRKRASGAVQSFVSLKVLRTILFPLPPLAEQERIVAKVEELMPYIEKYGEDHTKLKTFNK